MTKTIEVDGRMVEVEDMTPTPEAYRRMLRYIEQNSTSSVDQAWAHRELERVQGVTAWSTDVRPIV